LIARPPEAIPAAGPHRSHDPRVALAWSGGKDSALALWALREEEGIEPAALVTTVTADYDRISIHGVRRELLRAQAAAVDCPLIEVEIPAGCSNRVYEQRMAAALQAGDLGSVDEVAFGDLFLTDVRASRERLLGQVGKAARFPLWGRDTTALSRSFLDSGFRAFVVCVDPQLLADTPAGASYDHDFLASLPPSADPCGEQGEFHTFVWAGPIFRHPLECTPGEVIVREGLVFADLLPRAGG
jgi:uncharacterized protein (TIGR00290 family)